VVRDSAGGLSSCAHGPLTPPSPLEEERVNCDIPSPPKGERGELVARRELRYAAGADRCRATSLPIFPAHMYPTIR
jgi:hypothetical protein